jgi:eukaryotic-like serine/threonine-protein kinase
MMAEPGGVQKLGRFELCRRLGSGGMGVVYEALDCATGARVALKTLHERRSSLLLELKREFRAVHGIQHPNLVELGELFQTDDAWFFTMELVEGRDCMSFLRGDGYAGDRAHSEVDANARTVTSTGITPAGAEQPSGHVSRLRETLPQLVSALATLHAAGLVHRDVKPSNILMTAEGRLVLLDFGLVRSHLFDEQQTSRPAGTIAYMAPEQAENAPVTAAADCYSLGVILYEALTGRLPFVGSVADVLQQKRAGNPIAPSLLARDVPRDLEALCLELLARDPKERPGTDELLRRFPSQHPLPRTSAAPLHASHFVGRSEELARLRAAFDAAREGRPTAVLVHGESGIGKTSLLAEAARSLLAARGETLLLRGRCFEREAVAYAGVDMLIDGLTSSLRRLPPERAAFVVPRHADLLCQLFPTLETVPGFTSAAPARPPMASHEARARALAAFRELFARLAIKQRLVLVIDDAQWMTEESRLLLGSLFAPDDHIPLLLLISSRSGSSATIRGWLESLACDFSELALGPLAPYESIELLRQHASGATSETLLSMAADGAGHPLFLRELAEVVTSGTPAGPTQLDDCLRARASRLTDEHRAVLRLVCASTRPITSRVIGAASGLGPAQLETVLRNLKSERFVVNEGEGPGTLLQPLHDRVRRALLHELSDDAGIELQRRLAIAMEQQEPDDVDALAVQWGEAGDDQRAARFARMAAARAVRMLAFERAVELYDMALWSSSVTDAERGALFAAKGDALSNLGRGTEAASAYVEATRHCSESEVDDLVLRGADQLIRSGRIDDGKRLIVRVLQRLDVDLPESPTSALTSLLFGRVALKFRGTKPARLAEEERAQQLRRIDACWSIGDLLGLVDPLRALDLHTRGLRIALDVGDPVRLARLFAADAWFISSAGIGSKRPAFERLGQAEKALGGAQTPQIEGWITLCRGVVHLQMGDFEQAQTQFDVAESIFEQRCQGAFFEANNAREFAVWTLAYRGELGSLRDRLPRAIELATVSDNKLALLRLNCGPSHMAMLAADEPQQLLAACDALLEGLPRNNYPFPHLCTLFARAHASIYLGRAADAVAAIEAERAEIKRAQLTRSQFFRVDLTALTARAALAAIAERAVDSPRLKTLAESCARDLHRERVPWAAAFASAIDASLRTLTSDTERARQALSHAAEQLAKSGLVLYADALAHQARALGRADAPVGIEPDRWRGVVVRPERLARTIMPLPAR